MIDPDPSAQYAESSEPVDKVDGCRWDGEHTLHSLEPDEVARLSEGFCCDCQVPSQRDGEFTTCPCCRISWRIETDALIVRVPVKP